LRLRHRTFPTPFGVDGPAAELEVAGSVVLGNRTDDRLIYEEE